MTIKRTESLKYWGNEKMNPIKRCIYEIIQANRKKKISRCGNNVNISKGVYSGKIEIGSNVSINTGAWFVASRARIIIHDNVVIAPNVTIYTGSHVTNIVGKHICDITNADKDSLPDKDRWDKDVVIESGCWIGTRAIILKGVTIGRGSVVGAGSIVTKDVPPYSVYVGVPDCKVIERFSAEEIVRHEHILVSQGSQPDSFTF